MADSLDALDILFFDTTDFGLLDDDGNFEEFCLSMDFNPLLEEEDQEVPPSTGKRKFGALKEDANNARNTAIAASLVTDVSSLSSASTNNDKPKTKIVRRTDKVLPNDIVTQYPDMFCSIFNNFDRESFAELIQRHCEDDMVVVYDFVGHNPYEGPKYMEVRGLDTVVVFWDNLLTAIPDSVFANHATKYKVLPNGFTSVVCSFTFQGTKVFHLAGVDDKNNTDKSVVISMEPTGESQQGASAQQGGRVVASMAVGEGEHCVPDGDPKRTLAMQAREQTVFVTVVGTLTFYVNPASKIYRISFVHSLKTDQNTLSKKAKK